MKIRRLIDQRSSGAACACVCGAALLLVGCKTLEQIAPPADERLAMASGAGLPALERGRHIYLNQCTDCHVAEPIRDYNRRQWAEILPEMNHESNLTPAQAADLKAYIDACLAATNTARAD